MAKARKQTTPKGAEIPVPKRKDFYANLDKMVKAPVPARQPREAESGPQPGA